MSDVREELRELIFDNDDPPHRDFQDNYITDILRVFKGHSTKVTGRFRLYWVVDGALAEALDSVEEVQVKPYPPPNEQVSKSGKTREKREEAQDE